MGMPKTPVNEDGGTVFSEYDVGLSRQRLLMKSVPKALTVQKLSHKKLGSGIPCLDFRHHF